MRNIHIVSHTHWDREWYRPFQLFRLKLVHLVDGVLELLENDPGFKFFMLDGQTIVLDDYLAMRPEKEAELRRHIQKGRIIIGPWHILPDTFLVGPEAHIRNLLQGDRTSEKFGRKMMIGYLPDPFGHPGQIPQILQGFGIDTACLWRGLDEEPTEFWWRSPDGSQVLMAYLRDSYSNGANLPAGNPPDFAKAVAQEADKLEAHSGMDDFLIMFGTDHMEPPPGTAKAIAFADKNIEDTRVIHSTLPAFVEAVKTKIKREKVDLPVLTGELRQCRRMHLLPGVLSTRMWIKQRNHVSENLLLKWAEPFSTLATLIGSEKKSPTALGQPAMLVRETWRLLMENHPHDSICGCSIDQVHSEMSSRFDQVDQVGEELTAQSLDTLAANLDTRAEAGVSAVVVFNPLSYARTDSVKASLDLPPHVTDYELVDESGESVPYQTQASGSREIIHMTLTAKEFQVAYGSMADGRAAGMSAQGLEIRKEGAEVFIEAVMSEGGEPNMEAWKTGRKLADSYLADPSITTYHIHAVSATAAQVVFCAANVPGLGYKTLWIRPRGSNGKSAPRLSPLARAALPLARLTFVQRLSAPKKYSRPPYVIENGDFKVQAENDGCLTIWDKRTGTTYTGLNAFQDGADCGDEYNYAAPAGDHTVTAQLKHARVCSGPVQQSLELFLEMEVPQGLRTDRQARSKETNTTSVTCLVTLTSGVDRLDLHTTVRNSSRDHRLRVHFPAPFAVEAGQYDGHFEVVDRKIGLPVTDETWIEQPRPEVPERAFTDISNGRNGLMIANRGLPEVEVLKSSSGNGEIALTLLRCVGWLSRDDFSTRTGHAGPMLETPAAQMLGEWSFDYSIIPHPGGWEEACKQAYAFETPMRTVNAGLHEGKLPPSRAFVTVEPAQFVISTVKETEDQKGWLVRGYNLAADSVDVHLRPWKAFRKAEQVNLAEKRSASLRAEADGTVRLQARGHEIITVRFEE